MGLEFILANKLLLELDLLSNPPLDPDRPRVLGPVVGDLDNATSEAEAFRARVGDE